MRLTPRTDLGGFATGLPGVVASSGIEIERPFVLLCGPNGAGKTAMLSMIRSATGLSGSQEGHVVDAMLERPAAPDACKGDLGKLAAFHGSFGADAAPPRDNWAGIVDVRELGWEGQRTWLLDTRHDTSLTSQGVFSDTEFTRQVGLIMANKKSSHGQLLKNGWVQALAWALGTETARDPYDTPDRLNPARQALYKALVPGERSSERWLFLDEPETALDAESLYVGLCALMSEARIGNLRVFCASHSPLFAAGLGDHPSVQVVDMGGPRKWYDMQKRTLRAAADPDQILIAGATVAGRLKAARDEREAASAEREGSEVREALKGLGKRARGLLAQGKGKAGRIPKPKPAPAWFTDARDDLVERDLAKRGFAIDKHIQLTPLGIKAAALVESAPPKPSKSPRRKPARTDPPSDPVP